MRLLTHNMLHSAHKRGVQKGYPLNIDAEKTEIVKQEMNEMFLKNRLPKLDWNCFIVGCKSVGITDIPSSFDNNLLNNRQFLEKCHHALLEVHIIDGNLICPESKRKFPIRDGIPNMLLREDELPNINDNDLLNVYELKKNKKKNQNNNNDNNNLNEDENESKEQELINNNNSTSNDNNKLKLSELNNDNNDNNGNVKLINNGNTSGNNPYLDPLLMKGLQQFSPKANTNFVKSHTINNKGNQSNNNNNNNNENEENNTNCNDDNDIIMT